MRGSDPNEERLNVEQIATELQVSAQTVRNWIKSGELPAMRIGRGFRVRRADLDEMIDRQGGEVTSLGTNRDPWKPSTLGVPYRRRVQPKLAPSVWDGSRRPIKPTKRS